MQPSVSYCPHRYSEAPSVANLNEDRTLANGLSDGAGVKYAFASRAATTVTRQCVCTCAPVLGPTLGGASDSRPLAHK